MILVICSFVWWLLGMIGFVMYSTHKLDLDNFDELFALVMAGFLGLFWWVIVLVAVVNNHKSVVNNHK